LLSPQLPSEVDVLLLADAIYLFVWGTISKKNALKVHKRQFFSAEVLPKICFANGRYVARDRS
jgi:hypothetical protein